jgi:hypothetical protein
MEHTQIFILSLYDQIMLCKASNGRQPQNIKSGTSHQPFIGSYSNLKLRLRWSNQGVQILQMKTTSHGRRPQNSKNGISHQPLIGSYSSFKFKVLNGQTIMYKSFKWRKSTIEDNLQILKVEYVRNHCMYYDLWVLRGELKEN